MIKYLSVGPSKIKIEFSDAFMQLSIFLDQFPSVQESEAEGNIIITESNKKSVKLDKKIKY